MSNPIRRQRRPALQMELSPLIDCIFLLLVFFMLTSSFSAPALRLQLPKIDGTGRRPNNVVNVTIAASGELYLNRQAVVIEELPRQLRTLLKGQPQPIVTIRGDQKLNYDRFVAVLNAVRSSGATAINIAYAPQ